MFCLGFSKIIQSFEHGLYYKCRSPLNIYQTLLHPHPSLPASVLNIVVLILDGCISLTYPHPLLFQLGPPLHVEVHHLQSNQLRRFVIKRKVSLFFETSL